MVGVNIENSSSQVITTLSTLTEEVNKLKESNMQIVQFASSGADNNPHGSKSNPAKQFPEMVPLSENIESEMKNVNDVLNKQHERIIERSSLTRVEQDRGGSRMESYSAKVKKNKKK
ncbi:hypothetical protein HHI36_011642 [Cryptolaemus montrouzieri]|uniref:Uncharacterized protein n=1 Tax=Cryptolaemus montrouzieri TaxID=559131 RepID=A0ABD2MM83_9CUCU